MLTALTVAFSLPSQSASGEHITVFAAASLTDVLGAIAVEFHAVSPHRVRLSFAASSLLARQIEAGAPASIFASASEQWMSYLQGRGRIEPGTRFDPIENRLVLIAPGAEQRSDPLGGTARGASAPPPTARDLLRLLGRHGRIAMGDPAHVPAGTYARQALQSLGLWSISEARLAIADNVRAALALVERAETPLGIVYASDAGVASRVHMVAGFPASSHERIRYPFAIVKGQASPGAEAFMSYLRRERATQTFQRYGFRPTAGTRAHAQ